MLQQSNQTRVEIKTKIRDKRSYYGKDRIEWAF